MIYPTNTKQQVIHYSVLGNSKNNIYNLHAHPYETGAVNWYIRAMEALKLYRDEEDPQEAVSRGEFQEVLR